MSRIATPIFIAALTVSLAATSAIAEVRKLAPGASPAPATLKAFAWMAGRWVGEGFGMMLEETYSPAAGGVMLGHFEGYDATGAKFFELITLKEENGSVVLRLRHFEPDLTAWEDKDRSIEFPLVAIDRDNFYFSGLTIERVNAGETRHHVLQKHPDGSAYEALTHYRRASQ